MVPGGEPEISDSGGSEVIYMNWCSTEKLKYPWELAGIGKGTGGTKEKAKYDCSVAFVGQEITTKQVFQV